MNETEHSKIEQRKYSLRSSVEVCLNYYFNQLGGNKPSNLYHMVISEAEQALLKTVLEHTNGNQSRAADYLGITRGTLRKKLKQYELITTKK